MRIKRYIIIMIILAIGLPVFALPKMTMAATSDIAATRQDLEKQLADIQNQITQFQKQLTTIKGQKNTLTNKIKMLQNQQAGLKLQIQATTIKLDSLETQMAATQEALTKSVTKNKLLQIQMTEIIRQIVKLDRRPLMFDLLMSKNISDAFDEIQGYKQLMDGLYPIVQQVKETNDELTKQEQALIDQHDESQNLLLIKVLQQNQLSSTVADQKTILQETKGKESSYQSMLTQGQKLAAALKSRIYQLFNVGKQINFGQAVDIAKWVSSQTGVPTSFLLAILTQESNLGQNVGTCNRAGDPPSKSWKVIMKPTRDQEPFLAITTELGLDPNTTPVSCPMRDKSGNQVGWGGAMGPAQFIPSTWQGYKNKVAAITGKSPANPWDIRDAFLAAAIKLKAGGADSTRQGQWNAAMRYFSGSTNPAYSFYGDNVLALADKYEDDIAKLNAK